ncbi:flagellar motor switch phosphatase FliY [Alkalicoccus chagannorensis]|uniref:flagellar motor switch phosphatase FliY n=1 Tax=Alkalicoccus chagannorensis TaxID=427072 RepID=UPI0003FFB834|nr:flagellar motor switch phosphatase FliY [Alkalicoccus chagannorensis]
MMNDDMLSQDEINELLAGMDNDDDDDQSVDPSDGEEGINQEDYLTSIEEDALGEIGNISFGSSATALSTLLNQKVDITTPEVEVVKKNLLDQAFPKPHVAVSVEYTAGFEGVNLLVIKTSDAAIIADLMMGGDGTNANEDLGEMELSAVQEAMNQMMGSASTSMSTIFNEKVDITPPQIEMMDLKEDPEGVEIPGSEVLVQISFDLKIGDLIDSKIMQMLTVDFAKSMVDKLMNPTDSSPAPEQKEAPAEAPSQPERQEPVQEQRAESTESQQPTEAPPAAPAGPQHMGGGRHGQDVNVQPAAFSSFDAPQLNEQEARNLNMLMEIPLEVTVELGRTKRSIKEILEFTKGSVIELDKLAGEPVDVLVNQQLVAKGEVVVIDENFGVRVTDIVSREERLKNLR